MSYPYDNHGDPADSRPKFITLGPNKGQGTLTLPYLGQTMVPVFLIKMVKAQKLFIDDLFSGLFQGARKIELPPIPA